MEKEESLNGVEVTGDFDEVCEEAEEIKDKIENHDSDEAKQFDEWHPKKDDGVKDIEEKTIESAKCKESGFFKIIFAKFERITYKVMLKFNNYYYDGNKVQAQFKNGDKCKIEVGSNDKDLREELQE